MRGGARDRVVWCGWGRNAVARADVVEEKGERMSEHQP